MGIFSNGDNSYFREIIDLRNNVDKLIENIKIRENTYNATIAEANNKLHCCTIKIEEQRTYIEELETALAEAHLMSRE